MIKAGKNAEEKHEHKAKNGINSQVSYLCVFSAFSITVATDILINSVARQYLG